MIFKKYIILEIYLWFRHKNSKEKLTYWTHYKNIFIFCTHLDKNAYRVVRGEGGGGVGGAFNS